MQPFKTQLNGPTMMNPYGNNNNNNNNDLSFIFFLANSSDLLTSSPNSLRLVFLFL